MDLLKANIRKLYYSYLLTAFGSAVIACVYSFVDAAVIGKYLGPDGASALAVVAPFWNIIYSLGLLLGVGGGVIMSKLKGESLDNKNQENEYFTVSIIYSLFLSILMYIMIFCFDKQILFFFGAKDEKIMQLALEYLKPIKFIFPLFLYNQMLGSFLRNDNNPLLATIAVLAGGVFNIVGDVVFTFTCNMGIFGSALATTIGACITFIIMLIHFFTKKNTMKFTRIESFLRKIWDISKIGFSSFFVDLAMGILTILFNNQIMRYLNDAALSVYAILINITTFVQCCAYAVGQASQPIISTNYGAKNTKRIKETLKHCFYSLLFVSFIFLILTQSYPNMFTYMFMTPTDEVLQIAPKIIRIYSISFILLPINIFASYYFQSILKNKIAFFISTFRGLILSAILILTLPLINSQLLWYAMPITEIITTILSIYFIIYYTKKISINEDNTDK